MACLADSVAGQVAGDVVDDVAVGPVAGELNGGRARLADAEGMDAAKAVEHVATCAVGEDDHPAGDVPTRPVAVDVDRRRQRLAVDGELMQAAKGVEYVAAAAVGQEGAGAGGNPSRPVRNPSQRGPGA